MPNITDKTLLIVDLDETLIHAVDALLESQHDFTAGPYIETTGRRASLRIPHSKRIDSSQMTSGVRWMPASHGRRTGANRSQQNIQPGIATTATKRVLVGGKRDRTASSNDHVAELSLIPA